MNTRLPNIDALRGFAAAWVFAYHLWTVFAPGYSVQSTYPDHTPLTADTPVGVWLSYPLFGYGYAGVGLFFVLSGFCIHLPQARRFHRTGDDQLAPRPFFRRRLRRLYPAYFVSLFVSAAGLLAMTSTIAMPDGAERLRPAVVGVFMLVNAVFLLPALPGAIGLNGVYWTLCFEVQFYLLYPLLLKAGRRVGFPALAGVLLACELGFVLAPTPHALKAVAAHFEWFFLRRYFEWFLGMWLAERLAAGRPLPRAAAAVLAVGGSGLGVAFSQIPPLWPVHEVLLAVGGCGVVGWLTSGPAASADRCGVARRVFGWLGDCSYSLYLLHMPVTRLVFAAEAVLPDAVRQAGSFYAAGVVAMLLVPPVARLSFVLFERPFLTPPAAAPPTHPRAPARPGKGRKSGSTNPTTASADLIRVSE